MKTLVANVSIDRTRRAVVAAGLAYAADTFAQKQGLPRIGFVLPGRLETHGAYVQAFQAGLLDQGVRPGRDVEVAPRFSEGSAQKAVDNITELVNSRVAVLAVGSTDAGLLARKISTSIPVVFAVSDDPVQMGLVNSLARPGGNLTGVSLYANELIGKQLEILVELAPKSSLVGLLLNNNSASAARLEAGFGRAAAQVRRATKVFHASSVDALEGVFAALSQSPVPALLVPSDPFLNAARSTLVALAARYRIPALYSLRDFPTGGGLASYGVDYANAYRQAGVYAARIVRGEAPALLPVLQPDKFELVVNVAAARQLRLELPASVRLRADHVIE